MDGRTEGARDLLVAVFRLAVADYLGLSYGHDGPDRPRRVPPRFRPDAAAFLHGPWANFLAEQIGLSGPAIWAEAKRIRAAESTESRRAA